MKLLFRLMSWFWALSPALFAIGRFLGIWNTDIDWVIFMVLAIISTFVLFLNYETD